MQVQQSRPAEARALLLPRPLALEQVLAQQWRRSIQTRQIRMRRLPHRPQRRIRRPAASARHLQPLPLLQRKRPLPLRSPLQLKVSVSSILSHDHPMLSARVLLRPMRCCHRLHHLALPPAQL